MATAIYRQSPSPPLPSSPGSLSSASTSSSDRVFPVSPPNQLIAFPTSKTSSTAKPLLSSQPAYSPTSVEVVQRHGLPLPTPPSQYERTPQSSALQRTSSAKSNHSQSNPQPFFSLSAQNASQSMAQSPTTFEFPSIPISPNSSTSSLDLPSSSGYGGRDSPPKPRTRRQSQQAKRYGETSPRAGTSNTPSTSKERDGPDQLEAKVVLLGSQGVGKTSIVHWYTTSQFSYSLASTIGASFLTKRLVVDGCKIRLQLWDTAGQERFRSMAPLYYRGALAAILVYDISDMSSFNDIKLWLDEFSQNMSPDLIVHVVGSKLDLAPTRRQVDYEYAKRKVAEWAGEYGLLKPAEVTETTSTTPYNTMRAQSPSSPTRQKTRSMTTDRIPTITTSPPPLPTSQSFHSLSGYQQQTQQPTLGERVRKMSLKLGAPAPPSIASASSASSISENETSAQPGIVRSGSNFSIALGLGMSTRGRRDSVVKARKSAEELERERIDDLVRRCGIQVSEVSAKDADGIEDLFMGIALQLVERKAEIESARVLRTRDSIMLRDDNATTAATGAWCCSG